MTQIAEELAKQIIDLSESERMHIAQRIWESCDLPPALLEEIDNQIAAGRARALDDGRDPGIVSQKAFADARASLKCE